MKKSLWIVGLSFVSLTLGCQTLQYPDVHPMESGVHKVSFKTERKGDGYRQAMPQAQAYCQDVMRKNAVQVKESSDYIGRVDEDLYNSGKTASKVAIAVGGAGAVLGGDTEQNVGAVAAVGGGIADTALGLGYEYTLEFKCI